MIAVLAPMLATRGAKIGLAVAAVVLLALAVWLIRRDAVQEANAERVAAEAQESLEAERRANDAEMAREAAREARQAEARASLDDAVAADPEAAAKPAGRVSRAAAERLK